MYQTSVRDTLNRQIGQFIQNPQCPLLREPSTENATAQRGHHFRVKQFGSGQLSVGYQLTYRHSRRRLQQILDHRRCVWNIARH